MAFCPKCGKKTEKGFCEECRPKNELKVRDINIKACSSCRKYLYKNKWNSYSNLDDVAVKIAKESIKDNTKGMIIEPDIPNPEIKPGLTIDFDIEVTKGDEVFNIPAKISGTLCDECSKKTRDYLEGTLQLRNVDDDILDFIGKYAEKNNFFFSKKKKQDKGIDLDVSDQKKIQNLGHELQKNFGGILKISPRLFTKDWKTSKDVYRVNVYYEAPEYKKGAVIKIGRELIEVTRASKTISGVNIKTGKRVTVEIKGKDFSVLGIKETTVSKIYPETEVIDPETYQSVPVENKKAVRVGEKVNIVNDNGLFYIL